MSSEVLKSSVDKDLGEVELLFPELEKFQLLGRGGMGVVIKAWQPKLDRTVAIKLLAPERARRVEFEKRFAQEAKALAKLDHPNIVRVHDFGQRMDRSFLLMEYVEGEDLAVLRARQTPDLKSCVEMLSQVGDALQAAHDAGIIHRDIKPTNILVSSKGTAKLSDFGLARVAPLEAGKTPPTPSGLLGTAHYVAPELIEGRPSDHRADIYALGVVAYWLFTGALPLGHFSPPSSYGGIPRRIDRAVLRALSRDPAERFSSAKEFADELRLALTEPSVKAKLAVVVMCAAIVDSEGYKRRCGVEASARGMTRFLQLVNQVAEQSAGCKILSSESASCLLRLPAPSSAAEAALNLMARFEQEKWPEEPLHLTVGLHLGEILEVEDENAKVSGAVGLAVDLSRALSALAEPGQILMTSAVFNDARQFVRAAAGVTDKKKQSSLQWIAHGRYLLSGQEEATDIFELGTGNSPLRPPKGGKAGQRSVTPEEEAPLGWRPAVSLPVSKRPDWILQRKLGQGGFGEVWLAKNIRTKEDRVFKFCFDAAHLSSLKRELALFRLLRDVLGRRPDIARIHEVQVDQQPFYLESEYYAGGSLAQWVSDRGGLTSLALDKRIDLMRKICHAVAAAHSVGVIHKDIKPSNVLISEESGEPQPHLSDFGIGVATEPGRFDELGITRVGFTVSSTGGTSRGSSGTPLYMAPEYLVGGQPSQQGDVYALGVLLFQMIAGNLHLPVGSGWRREIADSLLQEDIERCIDVKAERRFANASELAASLDRLPQRRAVARQVSRAALTRRWMGIAALLMALIAAGFGYGYMRSQRAEKKAMEAQARAEDLVEFTLEDTYDALKATGRIADMQKALNEVKAHYERFPMEDRTPTILNRWSKLHARTGEIGVKTGHPEQAIAAFRECIELRRQLVAANPDNTEWRDNLADACDELGKALTNVANFQEAEDVLNEALRERNELLKIKGDDPEILNGIGMLCNNLAGLSERRGDLQHASELYDRSVEARRDVLKKDNSLGRRFNAAWAFNYAGWFEIIRGEIEQAVGLLNEANELSQQVLSSDDSNAEYLLCRATAQISLGYALAWQHQFPQAGQHMEDGLMRLKSLLKNESDDHDLKRRLGQFLIALGRKEYLAGRMFESATAFGNAHEILKGAKPSDMGVPALRAIAASLLVRLQAITATPVELSSEKLEALKALLKEESKLLKPIREQSPDDWRNCLAQGVLANAEATLAKLSGELEAADSKLKEAANIFRKRLEKTPNASEFKNDLEDVERQMGELSLH